MAQLLVVCDFRYLQKVLLTALIITIGTSSLSVHAISSEDKSCQREAGVNVCRSENGKASVFSFQGGRKHMEDTFAMEEIKEERGIPAVSLYGVFDGHNGDRAAKYTAQNLLVKMKTKLKEIRKNIRNRNNADYTNNGVINYEEFLKGEIKSFNDGELQKELNDNKDESGTTAVVALITKSQLYVANVGDSRAVLADVDGNAIRITEDHKPNSKKEWKRLAAVPNAMVEQFGNHSVLIFDVVSMAVSRSLGDIRLKNLDYGLIADADTFCENFSEKDAKFLIIASDGLWDVLTDEQAVYSITSQMNTLSPTTAEENLANVAKSKGSSDNITVMTIKY